MRWMEVDGEPDEAARRIGTPSGWLAAQARGPLTDELYVQALSQRGLRGEAGDR